MAFVRKAHNLTLRSFASSDCLHRYYNGHMAQAPQKAVYRDIERLPRNPTKTIATSVFQFHTVAERQSTTTST
eukprot:1698343-Amphidinium_carterae.1